MADQLINVVDPDTGQVGSIPQAQMQEAASQGYTQAAPEQVQQQINHEQYGSAPQELLTGLEHAGSSGSFGLTRGLETGLSKLGVSSLSPEAQAARSEENPVAAGIGDVAGLVGTSALGVGEGALLTRAGEAGAGALGLGAAETGLAKIGSAAVKGAIEGSLYGAGDENGKLLSNQLDANHPVQTALVNIGLNGLLGGAGGAALGSISPLWNATAGPKLSALLDSFKTKMGGIEGQTASPVKDAMETLQQAAAPKGSAFAQVEPDAFVKAREGSTRPQFLSPHTAEELGSHQTFLDSTGKVGYSLSPEGDIQGVFNNSGMKGLGQTALVDAIARGGKTLDAISGHLPEYYNDFGFDFKNSMKWDDKYAPANWDYKKYGRPDIVFMEYNPKLSRDPSAIAERFEAARSQRLQPNSGASGSLGDIQVSSRDGIFDWNTWKGLGQESSNATAGGAGSYPPSLNVPPEVKSILSSVDKYQQFYKDLRQSPTPAGLELANTVEKFRASIGSGISETIGKNPEEVSSLADLSEAKEGKNLGKKIAEELHHKTSEQAQEFEDLKLKKAGIPLTKDAVINDPANPYIRKNIPGMTSRISDDLAQMAQSQKWASDSESTKILNQTIKRLPEQDTIGDLDQLATRIQKENYDPLNPALNRDVQQIVGKLRDASSDATLQALAEEGPELVERHQAARAAWKQLSDIKDDLQSKLNLKGGNYNSNEAFVKNLRSYAEESPEKLLRKLTNPDDVYLSQTLARHFPETAQAVKDFQLNSLLAKAAAKAAPGHTLNPTVFFKQLNDLSPELRSSLFSPETMKNLEAHRTIWDSLNQLDKDRNFSNTAPTMARMLKNIPGTALGFIMASLEHNPLMGALVGGLANTIGRNAPDALKLATLKFMGSSAPTDSAGFKAAFDWIHNIQKGNSLMNKAVKNVFESAIPVISNHLIPDTKSILKLDDKLKNLQTNPEALTDIGGKIPHYLPNHAQAIAQTAATAVMTLNQARPQMKQNGPLDTKIEPKGPQLDQYHRMLAIAEQPLMVLQHLQNGSLTSQDVGAMKTLYPQLYERLSSKLQEQLVDHVSKDRNIPYEKRLGLSLFLGQPLDSSMSPQSIQMNQASMRSAPTPMQADQQARPMPASKLNKIAPMDATRDQMRLMKRSKY